jgi:hypothetical protein
MCYAGAYPNHMHITVIVKNNLLGKKGQKEKEKKTKEKHTDRD